MNRLLIAGSRRIEPLDHVFDDAASLLGYYLGSGKYTVVTGGARGVDTEAAIWAVRRGHTSETVEADWDRYGKRAGPERNRRMVRSAIDAAIVIWDGKSKGTADTISLLEEHRIPRVVIVWQEAP